jgi:hypothetical protein
VRSESESDSVDDALPRLTVHAGRRRQQCTDVTEERVHEISARSNHAEQTALRASRRTHTRTCASRRAHTKGQAKEQQRRGVSTRRGGLGIWVSHSTAFVFELLD